MMITSIGWTNDSGLGLPILQVFFYIGRASACHSAECCYCFNTSWRQMKVPKLKKCFRGHLWERTRHTLSCITKNKNMLVVCVGGGWSWHLCSLFYCWCSWYDVTRCGNLVGWQNLWYGLSGSEYQMLFSHFVSLSQLERKGLLIKSPGWFIFTFTDILPLLIVICFKLFLLRCWKAISEVRH